MSFNEWKLQMDKNVKAVLKNINVIQKEAIYELKDRVEKRTPIGRPELWKYPAPPGYDPGTLRASWGIEEKGSGVNGEFVLFNDQPYAQRVEEGWSSQAPHGMLRVSMLEWSSIVDKIASQRRIK